MNKYTWIWFWRNTVVPEAKGIFWVVVIIAAFACLTAQAQEVDPKLDEFGGVLQELPKPDKVWELTIVKGTDLIDMPHRFATKGLCMGLGIAYVRADHSLHGFVCELEDVEPT